MKDKITSPGWYRIHYAEDQGFLHDISPVRTKVEKVTENHIQIHTSSAFSGLVNHSEYTSFETVSFWEALVWDLCARLRDLGRNTLGG